MLDLHSACLPAENSYITQPNPLRRHRMLDLHSVSRFVSPPRYITATHHHGTECLLPALRGAGQAEVRKEAERAAGRHS